MSPACNPPVMWRPWASLDVEENPIPEDVFSYGIYLWLRQHEDHNVKGICIQSAAVQPEASELTVLQAFKLQDVLSPFVFVLLSLGAVTHQR
ncbi:hypothetical protein F7725_028800, partial [Dissostichus mawsoni]